MGMIIICVDIAIGQDDAYRKAKGSSCVDVSTLTRHFFAKPNSSSFKFFFLNKNMFFYMGDVLTNNKL